MPTACRPDRLPDVDVGMPGDQHRVPVLAPARESAIRLSFDRGTRWSTSTPSRRPSPGPNSCDGRRQVVQPVDRFHDDALDPQVVAPDPLDQRGVVNALHPDPGRPGGPGAQSGDDSRAGRGDFRSDWRCARGRTRVTCWPSTRNAPGSSGKSRRRPPRSSRVTVVDVQTTAAPQNPDSGSSATTSAVAGDFGDDAFARSGGQHIPAVPVSRGRHGTERGGRHGSGALVWWRARRVTIRARQCAARPARHARDIAPSTRWRRRALSVDVTYGCLHVFRPAARGDHAGPVGCRVAGRRQRRRCALGASTIPGIAPGSGRRLATSPRRPACPGPGWPSAGSAALLPLLREGGPAVVAAALSRATCAGLPIGGELTVAALDAGALVVLPNTGIALVPADGQWRAFRCPTRHPALGLAEAHEMLDSAVNRATRSLTALGCRPRLQQRPRAGAAGDARRGGTELRPACRRPHRRCWPPRSRCMPCLPSPTARTPRPSPATRWPPSMTCCGRWRSRSGSPAGRRSRPRSRRCSERAPGRACRSASR